MTSPTQAGYILPYTGVLRNARRLPIAGHGAPWAVGFTPIHLFRRCDTGTIQIDLSGVAIATSGCLSRLSPCISPPAPVSGEWVFGVGVISGGAPPSLFLFPILPSFSNSDDWASLNPSPAIVAVGAGRPHPNLPAQSSSA